MTKTEDVASYFPKYDHCPRVLGAKEATMMR